MDWVEPQSYEAVLSSLFAASGRRGGDKSGAELAGVAWGIEDEAHLRRRHAKDKFAGAICGKGRLLRAVVVGCSHGIFSRCSSGLWDLVAQPPMGGHHGDGAVGHAGVRPSLPSVLQDDGPASLLTYQMAAMLVGEVEHDDFGLCCIWIRNGFEDSSGENVRAFSFGMFHRWRVRALSLLDLRFNERD